MSTNGPISETTEGRVVWQAYCRQTGGWWFPDGWYDAASEEGARRLSTDGRIRSRIEYPHTEWVEQERIANE